MQAYADNYLVTAPAAEPISLDEAKAHCRQNLSVDDTWFTATIVAARQYAEKETRLALINQTWRITMVDFPRCGSMEIQLPKAPFSSLTNLKYYDTAGTLQTLSGVSYQVRRVNGVASIVPIGSTSWPAVIGDGRLCAQADYVAGFGAAGSDVPQLLRNAMLLLIGTWYENREEGSPVALTRIPDGAESIFRMFETGHFAG